MMQTGGPSQMDLFDPKPELDKRHGEAYFDQIAGEVENPAEAGTIMRRGERSWSAKGTTAPRSGPTPPAEPSMPMRKKSADLHQGTSIRLDAEYMTAT